MPSAAAALTGAPRKPPRVVVLPPSAFADDYAGRPDAEVAVGLKFVSVEDIEIARNTAVRRARDWLMPKGELLDARAFDEAYNDEVVVVLVARATTDPNDVDRSYFTVPEETVRRALTRDGARRVWDEMQLLHAGSGLAMPQADDEQLRLLGQLLRRGVALGRANEAVATEVRKLGAYLLEQLLPEDAEAALDEGNVDDDEDGVAVYTALRAA